MNILLVRPKPHKNTINLQSFMICEPLELEYVAAQLEISGDNVDIVDMIIEKKPLLHFLKLKKYDKVGFTCYITTVNIIKSYAQIVKDYDKNIITMVGGIVAEVNPHYLNDANIDEVITASPIPNYLPLRSKTMQYRTHYNYIFHTGCATLKTSYGCPYRCEFCYCSAITGGQYFAKDINATIEEIKTINESKIFIVDDNFLYDVERLNQFCTLLEQNNIQKEFIVFGRTDFVGDDANINILRRLYDNGLRAVFMGLESFKENELIQMHKGTSVAKNIKAVQTLEMLNIESYLGIIVDYDWNKSDFDNLIEQLGKFKYPFVNVQPILPLEGTPLYEKMKDKITLDKANFECWDMAHLAMKPHNMSIRKFYYNIVRVYRHTILKKSVRDYIKQKHGKIIYNRVKKGATKIFWQYIRLILRGKI